WSSCSQGSHSQDSAEFIRACCRSIVHPISLTRWLTAWVCSSLWLSFRSYRRNGRHQKRLTSSSDAGVLDRAGNRRMEVATFPATACPVYRSCYSETRYL